jgi:hypothetical protein
MSRLAALSATILFLAALLTAPFFPLIGITRQPRRKA